MSSVFHFTFVKIIFPELGEEVMDYFLILHILSVIQCVMTVFHFHISFYSRNYSCWDAMGWWFYLLGSIILRILIPIACIAIGLIAHFELKDGSNAYILLLMSNAFTSFGSTIGFVTYIKK